MTGETIRTDRVTLAHPDGSAIGEVPIPPHAHDRLPDAIDLNGRVFVRCDDEQAVYREAYVLRLGGE